MPLNLDVEPVDFHWKRGSFASSQRDVEPFKYGTRVWNLKPGNFEVWNLILHKHHKGHKQDTYKELPPINDLAIGYPTKLRLSILIGIFVLIAMSINFQLLLRCPLIPAARTTNITVTHILATEQKNARLVVLQDPLTLNFSDLKHAAGSRMHANWKEEARRDLAHSWTVGPEKVSRSLFAI